MGSRLSRQKNAAPATPRADNLRPLLRHGARFFMPSQEIATTATWLSRLGIIEVRTSLVVRCADPLDEDFPPPVRDCDGHITLRANADEGGGDYYCPSCERPVFPVVDNKRRYKQITVVLNRSGIEAFLIGGLGASARRCSFCDGVLKLPTDGLNAFVCLVEFCADPQFLRRGTAMAQPCVYVTVEPDTPARLLGDSGIHHVELVDILTEDVCLPARLREAVTFPSSMVVNVDVPIFAAGAASIGSAPTKSEQLRRFTLSRNGNGFLVDGLLIVDESRTMPYRILLALVQRFSEAVLAHREVAPMSVEKLADIIQEGEVDVCDPGSVRRAIVRIRDEITTVIRRETGKPIGDNDIIETVSRTGALKGAKGYRLNPRTVVLAAAMS
jgi:hypothetical protein